MDAHIATIVASYLPIHLSNVFLSTIGLSEHVITHRMANDHTFLQTSPRQTEILCVLGSPLVLTIVLNNIDVAVKSGRNFTYFLSKDFNALGKYAQTHPLKIAEVTWYQRSAFKKYLRSMLPRLDMRYTDFVYNLSSDIYDAYTAQPLPASSLNHHTQTPTIPVMAAILSRLKNDPMGYLLYTRYGTGVMYVTYRCIDIYEHNAQQILFNYFIRSIGDDMISDDDMSVLIKATFSSIQDILDSFLYNVDRRLYDRIMRIGL